jgi:hypothetical protein
MTTTQIGNVTASLGMVAVDSTTRQLKFYDGNSWVVAA